uniref:Zinc knuckle CX2CX4HX4C domain-containing protein n=1 Tax=Nelumbo nucifera TaxID=4432 RepID=A0A822XWD0_NELNU|nr:TPA_asm: hypothetical protein HUJ06_024924 [Nelumbo nucifera]
MEGYGSTNRVGPWTDSGDGRVEKLWLQLHYIPRTIVEDSRVKVIGLMASDIINGQPKIQTGVLMRGIYTRIQILLDIRHSLTIGLFVTVEGKKKWIRFCYESLTKLCAYYGFLGHRWQRCKRLNQQLELVKIELEQREIDLPGEWLRAEYRPERPLKIPTYREQGEGCRVQLIRMSETGSDEASAEKRRCLEDCSALMNRNEHRKACTEKDARGIVGQERVNSLNS